MEVAVDMTRRRMSMIDDSGSQTANCITVSSVQMSPGGMNVIAFPWS